MNFTNDHRGTTIAAGQCVITGVPALKADILKTFGVRYSLCPPATLRDKLDDHFAPLFSWIDNDLLR